jgi:hypothetical protein
VSNSLDELRELLDSTVREPARTVHVDAASAWRQGRRRRTANRVAVAAVVVFAVAGGVLALSAGFAGLPTAVSPAKGSGPVADEHPRRLDHAYWDDGQPRVTGPLAGVVHRSSEGGGGWYSVSPAGHLWRVPVTLDWVPSLSPDGTHLAYMHGGPLDGTYRIVDQVDGTTTTFPEIGTGTSDARVEEFDRDHRYFYGEQEPAFWSPDGTALLIQIGLNNADAGSDPAAAVLGIDGSFVTIPLPAGAGAALPVGWVDEHHVAVLTDKDAKPGDAGLWIVDLRSGLVVRRLTLEGAAGANGLSQWLGSVSPDGRELATMSDSQSVRFYSTTGPTAGELTATLPVGSVAEGCQPSWSSTDLYVPTDTTMDGESRVLTRANGGVTVWADPRLHIVCSTWARTALDGPAHDSLGTRLFGDNTNWLSWHWREVASSGLLAIALALGVGLVVRRRTRRERWVTPGR